MRQEFVRAFDPIDLTDLRAAHTRRVDLDEDLSALKGRNFDFIDDQRLALLDQNCGGGFQINTLATDKRA